MRTLIIKQLLIIPLILFPFSGIGQQYNYSLEAKPHFGFIIPHSPTIARISRQHFNMLETSINFHNSGQKPWQQLYFQPNWGLTWVYSGLGGNPYFGQMHELLAHFNFQAIRKKHYRLEFKLGTGIGFVEKVFDPVTNYKNLAIGSRINAAIELNFNQVVRINKNLDWISGLGLNHQSNGAAKMPNKGINIFTVNTGIRYSFGKIKEQTIEKDSLYHPGKRWLLIKQSGGLKEDYPPGGSKYLLAGTSVNLYFRQSDKNYWGTGIEYMFDASTQPSLEAIYANKNFNGANHKIGICANYLLMINRLGISLQLGAYVFDKYKSSSPVYDRIGLNYFAGNHIVTFIALKTHFAKADYIEYGLAYKF
jgi:hypothetical protein